VILVDTNVVSEVLRLRPEPAVCDWLDGQAAETLFISAISLAEIWVGITRLPDGQRKRALDSQASAQIERLFAGRVLGFDEAAARAFAGMMAAAGHRGLAISLPDGLIAATALSHGLAVASRDVAPFAASGLQVINPWLT
jgi:predicted nucleic acid-binding protein